MRYTLRHAFAAAAALSLLLICNRAGFAAPPYFDSGTGDAGDLNSSFGSIDNWTIKAGTWTMAPEGRLRGEGNSTIVFNKKLPYEGTISFNFNVVKGVRPRFYFDGAGLCVGNQGAGRSKTISVVERKGVESPVGLPYDNGDQIHLSMKLHAGTFELRLNDNLLTGTCASADTIQLRLRGGDFYSKGTTEFWDFHVGEDENAGKKPDQTPPPDSSTPTTTLHIDSTPDTTPIPGPATKPVGAQATVNALEVYEMEHGMMLGQTSEATLTLTGSTTPKAVSVRFVTEVGDQMSLARDEALRYIRLKYPNWYVSKAEITFEDKYVAHDGGSIGTALGTLILSCIQGFDIDPKVAITGDISANGKTRAIGGVSAKIKGAIASKCSLVAIPADNLDQLVDAVTYNGPEMVENIQVIGIADLDDAVATIRTDRNPKLTQAIAMFGDVQKTIKTTPAALKTKEVQEKLQKILALIPQHLSAQVLLSISQGKQPKTLSATASLYYTFMAVGNMIDVLKQRSDSNATDSVPSSVVRNGLANLHKLRPLADPAVRPLIDAWASFIGAWNEQQEGIGSPQSVEKRRQALLDEMAREDADVDLMQKMLREGM